jgi:hypothetical protein
MRGSLKHMGFLLQFGCRKDTFPPKNRHHLVSYAALAQTCNTGRPPSVKWFTRCASKERGAGCGAALGEGGWLFFRHLKNRLKNLFGA